MSKVKILYKTILIISITILMVGGILLKVRLMKKDSTSKIDDEIVQEKEEINKEEKEPENIFVDIKGAVINEGVYEIASDKKVIDVINLAGGFTEEADTSMINLAKQVKNEMVIIIYTKDEVKKATEPNQIIKYVDKQCICPNIKNDACINNSKTSELEKNNTNDNNLDNGIATNQEKVNINTASLEELQTLNGIGESKARAIIAYREEHGGFKSIEEIKEISGIGDSLYEKIKDSITI